MLSRRRQSILQQLFFCLYPRFTPAAQIYRWLSEGCYAECYQLTPVADRSRLLARLNAMVSAELKIRV